MDWNASIFIYCERGTDPAFWAEPFNALSNAAFVLAGLAGLRRWLGQPAPERGLPQLLLVLGVFAVSIGSFLFHTFANAWSQLADIIPIGIVMLGFLWLILARILRVGSLGRVLGLAAFVAAMALAMQVRCTDGPCLNGSVGYVPALAGLVIVGAILAFQGHPATRYILGAAGVFAVSLLLRTFDRSLCGTISLAAHPIGTHFLWHSLNGVLLYLLLMAAIRHGMPRQAEA
jgi:Ceramidase